MNAKYAKAMRQALRSAAQVKTGGKLEASYELINKRYREVENPSDGEKTTVLWSYTARMAKLCPRNIYQRSKRNIKRGYAI